MLDDMGQSQSPGSRGSPARPAGLVPRHGLLEQLGQAARVTVVSAPAGSGKTSLLRSWIAERAAADSAAWVTVRHEHRDPQQFWVPVLDALRTTVPGSRVVRQLTAAPELDGWLIVERLLQDLHSLPDHVWLVLDDVHELHATEALRQLELLLMRAPAQLRFVLSMRHDLRLGLHRLRLEGELAEVRAADLQFSLDEARALFKTAAVALPDPALRRLHERTEGWAAGLKLAALSLTGHPDPERFATEFSGSERTVAEYLLAEVLERQPEAVRRLLLHTSILERVSGSLADLLTGDVGTEAALHRLEQANAFVTLSDPTGSWFRYHRLFADLLYLQLRRTAPGEVPTLHAAAADWFAAHGYPIEAVRHAQAAQRWGLAARLLFDHAPGLQLDGRAGTVHELLSGFPDHVIDADPELLALMATRSIRTSRPAQETQRFLALAGQSSPSAPPDRRGRVQVCLSITRLWLAKRRGDLPAVLEQAEQLLAPAEVAAGRWSGQGEDLRALALFMLGAAELAHAPATAERHLEQAVALARQIGRPSIEADALAYLAMAANSRSFALGAQRGMQAIELARRHGWSEDPFLAIAHHALAEATLWQARPDEAEAWLEHAEPTLSVDGCPGLPRLHITRGLLELARGRPQSALANFRTARQLNERVVTPAPLAIWIRTYELMTLLRLDDADTVEKALADMSGPERETTQIRIVEAELRLARQDPLAATAALAPALKEAETGPHPAWRVQAFLLEAIAREALGDSAAATNALERALDLAEPDGVLLPFLLHATPLLARHAPHHTTHASLIADILDRHTRSLPGTVPTRPPHLREPLSPSELRILRYLPTNLTMQEIAHQLSVSVNTVKAHARHLYAKLHTHTRAEAVERARALHLLAPAGRSPGTDTRP